MSRRMPWLKRKKTAPDLPLEPPIRLGNMSNGEFFHEATPREKRIRAEILRQADDRARKLGIDRREFLASAMGMATSLSVLNTFSACSNGDKERNNGFFDVGASGTGTSSSPTGMSGGAAGMTGSSSGRVTMNGSTSMSAGPTGMTGGPTSTGAGGMPGMSSGSAGSRSPGAAGNSVANGGAGGYQISEEAMMNCEVAEDILSGTEFIMDCQTHHVEQEGEWRMTNPGQADILASYFSQYNMCQELDATRCIDAQAYLEKIFLESDTSLAVLSGYPAPLCTDGRMTGCGNPLDNDLMWRSRDRFNAMANSQRVIQHCQVNPTDNLDLQLAIMERIKSEHNCWGFKSYPEWGPDGSGWMLDDANSGIPMIEKAREVNSKIICVHKGIVFPGWDAAASHPRDVGVVAKMYPDTAFVVYHSAIELDAAGEGPYNPDNTQGVDRLCRTAAENNMNGNIYAELGSCWAQVMNAPELAQHVIGKLLKYVGPDNVLWGSECIWLGSPQQQIEAFRTFQISKEFQDMYGYPEITPEIRAKVFGLNAARIYGIDPAAERCRIKETKLARLKTIMDGEVGLRRWAFNRPMGPRTRREFWNLARMTGGRPG